VLSPPLVVAFVFAVASVCFFATALAILRRGGWLAGGMTALVGLLFLAAGALAATVTVGIRGYRALTLETVAATVSTEPLGAQRFRATMRLPDQRLAMYELAGDAFYVDAHILKWHSLATLLGLRTVYELDRVAGRYTAVTHERTRPRTVYSLARPKPVDMFDLARRFRLLAPLVDAEYGSATFVAAGRPATFEVRVSTTGLLIRPTAR
jgi:hypothetical protein